MILLVRAFVHDVIHQVIAYSAVVDEGDTFRRCTVTCDTLTVFFSVDEKPQQLSLGCLHLLPEGAVDRHSSQAKVDFSRPHLAHPIRDGEQRIGIFDMSRSAAQKRHFGWSLSPGPSIWQISQNVVFQKNLRSIWPVRMRY